MTSLASFSLWLTLFTCGVASDARTQLEKEVIDPTVHIQLPVDGGNIVGSGSLIQLQGKPYILTASHVVENCYVQTKRHYFGAKGEKVEFVEDSIKSLNITLRDGRILKAKPVWRTADYYTGADLALCEFEGDTPPKDLVLASVDCCAKPTPGEDVWYCGSGGAFPFNLEKTIVNQLTPETLTVNGHGWYGHSGSGTYIKRGDKFVLVAVLVRFQEDPRRFFKSPVECERRLHTFFTDFEEYLKKTPPKNKKESSPFRCLPSRT